MGFYESRILPRLPGQSVHDVIRGFILTDECRQ